MAYFKSMSRAVAPISNLGQSIWSQRAASNIILNGLQRRHLSLHEYQSMSIMQKYGVKTPLCLPASTPAEAKAAAEQLKTLSESSSPDFVVKAQVLAGGRGLGYFKENNFRGGVQLCSSVEEVAEVADKMLKKTLVTKQTGEEGKPCNQVLVAERFYIRKERYLALILDRETEGPVLLASSVGGTNIEEIAEQHPDSIIKMPLSLNKPPSQEQLLKVAKALKLTKPKQIEEAIACIKGLYQMFIEKDCLLIEVNPFAETSDERILACDAKVNFDDNTEFRQSDIFQQQDESQMDMREVAASRANLNYVGLDGNIGCMVNGAGLAMATMDLIQLHGGKPSNFLDVGGSAQDQEVVQALKILQEDPRVSSIFVNIFGGIMKCDIIAQGLITASKKIGLSKPLVLRLEGTNRAQAQKLLDSSGLKIPIVFEPDFNNAAKKAVKIASIVELARSASVPIMFA